MQQTLNSSVGTAEIEFVPFPNVERRNWLQSHLEIPAMSMALGLPSGVRVLEVGCGRGVGLVRFFELLKPARLVGLDIDRYLLAEAHARLNRSGAHAELVQADARCMPFEDGEFDLVIDFGTCYHIARPAEALHEIARVLVPGGLFATESRLSQLLAHPLRTRGTRLPWNGALSPVRHAGLWLTRRRCA
jgi:ubiquinone/menaquinone biosynthesis C-methylase UbiE